MSTDNTSKLLINDDDIRVRSKLDSLPIHLTQGYQMGIEVGDTVQVTCRDRTLINDDTAMKTFYGKVVSLFNALDAEGNDHWEYELRGSKGEWFLYKQRIDGGTITLITKGK